MADKKTDPTDAEIVSSEEDTPKTSSDVSNDSALDDDAIPSEPETADADQPTDDAISAQIDSQDGEPNTEHSELETDVNEDPATDPDEVSDAPSTDDAAHDDNAEPDLTSESETVQAQDPIEEPAANEPIAAADTHDAHHDELLEEYHGPSFASRALTALLLLLVGAGLGIWAAPKIAPRLPSGMSGVAEWLTPGTSDTSDRIAALESRVETDLSEVTARFADLDQPQDLGAEVETAVGSALGAASADFQSEIATIKDQLSQIDLSEMGQRLSQVETSIEGQIAELGSIKEQFEGGAAATSALSEQAAQQIDVYRAELEGLRAELTSQSGKVSALGSRVDEVDAKAERQIETAQAKVAEIEEVATTQLSAASAQADLAQVSAALAAGSPFADALQPLVDAPEINVPEGLVAASETGAPTIARLRDQFNAAAHNAVQASIMTDGGDGLMSRTSAFLRAQVASRSLTPQEGQDPDAVLSRMEADLRDDDLAAAIDESALLPDEAVAAMSDWLDAARLRQNAEDALADLTAELSATN